MTLPDIELFYDVSGPALVADGDRMRERPVVVGVHGGPGLDHSIMKSALGPLTEHAQVVFYDQRGHGRSDHGVPGDWNLRTWATDLRDFCDALGLVRPIVLGESFGGFVAATYAGMFPRHPGGVILANTTGGRLDPDTSVEVFRRLGGDEPAEVARRDFDQLDAETGAAFERVCLPLFSARPGFAEEVASGVARALRTEDVNLHFNRALAGGEEPDPWLGLGAITCPVLVLAGTDDPVCTIDVVEGMVAALGSDDVTFVRLEGARHAIFRDAPEECVRAVLDFAHRIDAAPSRVGDPREGDPS